MPKFFTLDGSTVREAKKVFVNDNGTIREAKKIYALDGSTVRTVFDSFSIAIRGTWKEVNLAATSVGFSNSFSATTSAPEYITKTGTFDPQAGDILFCHQVQVRQTSYPAAGQHPTLDQSGTMIEIDTSNPAHGEGKYTTSHIYTSGKVEGDTYYVNHRPVYTCSYKVLTGSDTAYSGANGFSHPYGNGEGNIIMFHLYRPTQAITSSNVLESFNSTPLTVNGTPPNQTITGISPAPSAAIQFAISGNVSGSATDQTTSLGGETITSAGTGYAGASMATKVNVAGTSNTAIGVDRGNSNSLSSGSLYIYLDPNDMP
jgi:hypothetical protein